MYEVPEQYDTEDYLVPVDDNAIDACADECSFPGEQVCSDHDVQSLLDIYMMELGLTEPASVTAAVSNYLALRNQIFSDI